MNESSVLGQVFLGYSPVVGRDRRVTATRLTVFPAGPDASPDLSALLDALAGCWPGCDGAAFSGGGPLTLRSLDATPKAAGRAAAPATDAELLINVADETLLGRLMAAGAGRTAMIEVPAFVLADPTYAAAVHRLAAAGQPLLLKGRSLAQLPGELLACFGQFLGEGAEPPAHAPAGARRWALLTPGQRSIAAVDAAYAAGAAAVVGWPLDDAPPNEPGHARRGDDIQVILELMQGVDLERPVAKLEAVLKRDPALAFKLMRYLNSPAFGLTVEINSLGQALQLLGYQRLKRWLALLLASSGSAPNAPALVWAAVRRGMLMEELVGSRGDTTVRGELFICGLFSLLDRLLQQPLVELLRNVAVPAAVEQALAGGGGPYGPYLQLVAAIEQESLYDIRAAAESLLLGAAEINRSLLAALKTGRQLDG